MWDFRKLRLKYSPQVAEIVRSDTNEKIYTSGALAVGGKIENAKLDVDLDASPIIELHTHDTDLKNRLTAPYSEERREAARRYARENNAADRLK